MITITMLIKKQRHESDLYYAILLNSNTQGVRTLQMEAFSSKVHLAKIISKFLKGIRGNETL